MDYRYNIRGWLTDINNIDTLSIGSNPEDLFAFKINYNKSYHNEFAVPALYNGNISETLWVSSTDNVQRKYNYQYDNLNRLRYARYEKPQGIGITDMYDEQVDYDKNGNIQHLNRNGDFDADDELHIFNIDQLNYTYDTDNKNRLMRVEDTTTSTLGFKDDNSTGSDPDDDYTYDDFGNMLSDTNKKIDSISYNHLNLPVKIYFASGDKIQYLYNAAGQKVRKTVTKSSTDTVTDYQDGFQYMDYKLTFFAHAEGYVNVLYCSECEVKTRYNYVFNYLDHLGNIRMSYAVDPDDNILKILEENHYYPFGLKHTNYNSGAKGFEKKEGEPEKTKIDEISPFENPFYKYKFQGTERQDELGLNTYDYGARNYDPALGRWMNIDPLAEKSRRFSPYTYALNNPVYFIDPDGMQADDWFVNNKSGGVVYVKGESKLTQEQSDAIGAGDAKNYDRLGPDEMFGNTVPYGYDSNLLDNKAYNVENPENFMKEQGYDKAENVTIKESEQTSGGRMGEENITQVVPELKQIGDSKITYARTCDLNSKENIKETSATDKWSSSKTIKYDLTKPFGQDNHATAEYYTNRSSDANIGKFATFTDNLMKIANAVMIAIQK